MSKNAYLLKKEIERQTWTDIAFNVAVQYMIDTLIITLHREDRYGYDRIMRLMDCWAKTRTALKAALNARDPECDVCQEHIDRALVQIINGKQELIPWDERYPDLRKVRY